MFGTNGTRRGVVFGAVVTLLTTAMVAGGVVAGCGSDTSVDDGGDAGSVPDTDGATTTDDGATKPPPASDASTLPDDCADASADAGPIDCSGKCGPVKDKCTGKITQCGGCQDVNGEKRVCDLASNTCIKPKVTCTDLGAECGTVKDSCGNYLDCPDTNPKGCAAGKECDPDTKKCRDCQQVTCQDLGKECGFAWLGCGEDTPSNYTDCGQCAPLNGQARVCNPTFNICEPQCVPQSAATICAAAKAKSGVECGILSNGCGGTVNCDSVPGFGCAAGESCGVRGIANRCDPKETPDECKALGKNCGTITSACTGLQVKCGDCPSGQVCNANGVCGSPCTPKTCDDFKAYECGTFDDGCGSKVTCGNCANGVCDQVTNKCCATNTCAATYGGKCGSSLPNGCGQNAVTCACAAGTSCTVDGGAAPMPPTSTTGMCCTPLTATSYTSKGQCGTNLPNGCGLANINASCPSGQECVANGSGQPGPAPASGVVGSCCVRNLAGECAADPAGTCAPAQDTCRPAGTMVSCSGLCTGGKLCANNVCCQGAPACSGSGGEGAECNDVKQPVDANCGSPRTCTCNGGRVCMCGNAPCVSGSGVTGACKSPLTCLSAGYAGKCGTGLDNGVGGTISCGCPTGQVCSTSTPGQTGTCACNNLTGQPYTCANVPNGPNTGGDACGSFSNGCGGSLTCGCPAGQTCNTAANPNVCCTAAVCPTAALGSACGALPNNCGGTINCGCPNGTGNENFTCTGGTCQCIKDTCRGRTGPQPDRCGGTLNCGG